MSKNVMNEKKDRIYLYIALPLVTVAVALWVTAFVLLAAADFSLLHVKSLPWFFGCLLFGGLLAVAACCVFYALLNRKQTRLRVLATTKLCPDCGKRVDKKFAFCPACGRTFKTPEKQEDKAEGGIEP